MQWIKQALSSRIGNEAEALARRFLENNGLIFVQRNYRCRTGEVDLIMQSQETLVFVEVKFRSQSQHGKAIEYFHSVKRRKFESAVAHYLQQNKLNPSIVPHRIDLVGIELNQSGNAEYNWLQNI